VRQLRAEPGVEAGDRREIRRDAEADRAGQPRAGSPVRRAQFGTTGGADPGRPGDRDDHGGRGECREPAAEEQRRADHAERRRQQAPRRVRRPAERRAHVGRKSRGPVLLDRSADAEERGRLVAPVRRQVHGAAMRPRTRRSRIAAP
jgi:hypothetical protein